MVHIPVRVNPPPAEIGEIISPGCAFLVTTTPATGVDLHFNPTGKGEEKLAEITAWKVTNAVHDYLAAINNEIRAYSTRCCEQGTSSPFRLARSHMVSDSSSGQRARLRPTQAS